METKRFWKKILIIYLFYLISENQEAAAENNGYTEKYAYHLTLIQCNSFDNGSSNNHPHPHPIPKPPAQEIPKRNFLFKKKSPNNFWPPDQKIEKERKKEKKTKPKLTSALSLQWLCSSPCRGRTCCFDHWGRKTTSLPLSNTADRCLQVPGVLHQLLFWVSRDWLSVEVIPNSSKMPSRQPVFSKLGRILEPISGEAEHQVGPRDPKSLLQDSCPLGISGLQNFF